MCIFNKLKETLKYGLNYTESDIVDSDYYNGSEDDLVNIFIELSNLADKTINVFNRTSYSNRIKFLANEGLHIISVNQIKAKSFKSTAKDIDSIIAKQIKKKTVKKKK